MPCVFAIHIVIGWLPKQAAKIFKVSLLLGSECDNRVRYNKIDPNSMSRGLLSSRIRVPPSSRRKAWFYSVLSAITGSFLAAELAGIIPERQVRPTLSAISRSACHQGSAAI